VDHRRALIVRRIAAAALALVAGAELVVLALLAAGFEGRTLLGPFVVVIHGVEKPLWVGIAAASACALLSWRSRTGRALSVGLIAVLIAVGIAALARTVPDVVTKSDIAITELYVQLAAEGSLLVGPYSRFFWHHPGPLYFYMQVPFYAISGDRGAGLYVGALAINLLALAMLAWVLVRHDRGALTVTMLGIWLLVAHRAGFLAASPWTAHVPVLATLTFLAVAAAAASGRRWMLPFVVAVGSFLAQCHVALVPLVIVLSLVALTGAATTRGEPRPPLAPALHASAWTLAAMWLLPIAEQLSHKPGNLIHLWTFFTTSAGATPSYFTSLEAWSYATIGVLRPDLSLPYGGHFRITHPGWAIPLAIVEVAGVTVVGAFAHRASRRFETSLAWMAATASLVSLWSISRIHGDILDHEIFWVVPLGAANLAIIAAAVVRRLVLPQVPPQTVRAVVAMSCLGLVLASVGDGVRALNGLIAFERAALRRNAELDATYRCIRDYLDTEGIAKPLFRIEQWDTAAAVFVRLHGEGRAFVVEEKSLPIFTETFAPRGDEDAIVAIRGSAARADAAGPAVVLQRDPVYIEALKVLH
jgi:hypothetical protein